MSVTANYRLQAHYGKAKRSPRNRRATAPADAMRPGFAPSDFVAGPALVIGSESGEPADTNDGIVRFLPIS